MKVWRYIEDPPPPLLLVPRWVLADGDGDTTAGFKAEWSALHGDCIVFGSHGYEVWPGHKGAQASAGHLSPPPTVGTGLKNVQWVKKINLSTGGVAHVDWSTGYNAIASALGVRPPGYVTSRVCIFKHEPGLESEWV